MNRLYTLIITLAAALSLEAMERPLPAPQRAPKQRFPHFIKPSPVVKSINPALLIDKCIAMGNLESKIDAIIDQAQSWQDGTDKIDSLLFQYHPNIDNEDIEEIAMNASRKLNEKITGKMSEPVYPKNK